MMESFFGEHCEVNMSVFYDDIRNGIKDMDCWRKRVDAMEKELKELKVSKEELENTIAEACKSEKFDRMVTTNLAEELSKLQLSLLNMVEIKTKNVTLTDKLKEYEKQIKELTMRLESEREANKRLMQRTCTEIADQANKELLSAQSEIDRLREQLNCTQTQLKKTTAEFQTKLKNSELARKDDLRQTIFEYQEKTNELQSELNSTRAHCRDLQEKMRTDSSSYQKKIKELEKTTNTNPFLRAPASTSRKSKPGRQMPQLDFVNNTPPGDADKDSDEQPKRVQLKKRKLFQPSDDLDDDFI